MIVRTHSVFRWVLVVMTSLILACAGVNSHFKVASQRDTIEAYAEFLAKYPEGEQADQARTRITELTEIREWEKAKATHTLISYQAYLERYPEGRFIDKCQGEIDRLTEIHLAAERAKATKRVRVFCDNDELRLKINKALRHRGYQQYEPEAIPGASTDDPTIYELTLLDISGTEIRRGSVGETNLKYGSWRAGESIVPYVRRSTTSRPGVEVKARVVITLPGGKWGFTETLVASEWNQGRGKMLDIYESAALNKAMETLAEEIASFLLHTVETH